MLGTIKFVHFSLIPEKKPDTKHPMKSGWQTIVLSVCSAIIGGVVVAVCFLFFVSRSEFLKPESSEEYGAGAGYKMLEAFQCRYGETKHILMNGTDDNFELGASEPGKVSERLAHMPGHPVNDPFARAYDETGNDKNVVDYFIVPPKVVRGIFVTRILPKKDYGKDYISLGDFNIQTGGYLPLNLTAFSSWLNELPAQEGWSEHGAGLFSVELKDLNFQFNDKIEIQVNRRYNNLLQYLKGQQQEAAIDFMVTDDTTVDFTGMAICTEPREPLGLTFSGPQSIVTTLSDVTIVGCDRALTEYPCNPIYGDTLCSSSLPLACFKDESIPVPQFESEISEYFRKGLIEFWSGGLLDFTHPVKGQDLDTIQSANNLCAQEFGDGWRVLDFHDGGIKNVVSPRYSDVPESRFWVDIKDQPKGTCWSRGVASDSNFGEQSP